MSILDPHTVVREVAITRYERHTIAEIADAYLLTEQDKATLCRIVERWEANDATEMYLDQPLHVMECGERS